MISPHQICPLRCPKPRNQSIPNRRSLLPLSEQHRSHPAKLT
uniref:Uncharacterized protein n=1 Tax=Arundo donax TaxID=35708 RepID=A0A0A9ETS8_ARUDO